MKTKLFVSILFCSYTFTSSAQTSTPTPVDNCSQAKEWKMDSWAVGINVNTVEPLSDAGFDYIFGGETRLFNPSDLSHQKDKSSSFGINISYNIRESCAIRLSAKRIDYQIDETYNFKDIVPSTSGSDYLSDDAHFRQTVVNILPGILWNLKYKKLDFYCGFQLTYKKYSPIDFQIRYTQYSSSNNAVLDVTIIDFKQQGGFSIGVGPVVGFSVNVFKCVFVGAEFSSAYSYYKTGGKRTKTHTFYSGATDTQTLQNSYETYKFSTIVSSINLGIKF